MRSGSRAVLAAVAIMLAVPLAACRPGASHSTAGGSPTPAEPTASGTASATAGATDAPSTATPGTTTAASGPRLCRPADLKLAPITGNGAAGTVGYPIVVTNTGVPCRLPEGYPVVHHTDSTGATPVLPTRHFSSTVPGALLVGTGQRAGTALTATNGYGGYDPSGPECAHPAKYTGLFIDLGSTGRLALTGLTLDVKCGEVTVYPWQLNPA